VISIDEDGRLSQLGPLLAVVVPDTAYTDLHLIGELDLETGQILDTLVKQQIATGHLEVRLDLAQLTFCDVYGLRTLLRAKRRLTDAGGQLVLLKPAPLLVRLAGMCGWSAELGLKPTWASPPSAVAAGRPEPEA
jgi:anti-sigma B factor antagonist